MENRMDLDWINAPHSMGTTIMGVTYNGGVVLGADSRTSTGMYVANRASDKITQLTDNVYLCRSGSAADSQVVSDYVRYFLHQHIIQLGQPATVKVAANLIRLLSYQNKNMLETGLIVGGWDKYEGGRIYSVPLGGTMLQQPFAIGGSGSSYLYGFLDQAWKEGMSKEEAEVNFTIRVARQASLYAGEQEQSFKDQGEVHDKKEISNMFWHKSGDHILE